MKLAVDARLMAGHPRGMGQYARNLVRPVTDRMVSLLPARADVAVEGRVVRSGSGFEPWWEQCVLPSMASDEGVQCLLCPSNTAPLRMPGKVATILVVHDLIYLASLSDLPLSRSAYQNLGRLYRRMVVPRAVKQAQHLIAVSAYTRDQICERFDIAAEDVHLITNSLESTWFVDQPLPDELRQRYLLAVVGEAPSKNLSGLLRAFALMRRDDLSLRVVGVKPGFHAGFRHEAERLGIASVVHFEGHLSTAHLKALYREAWGFVMPSLYEGFGIPVLEAMASGVPVACSNTTSLPEVAGGCAWLFNPRADEDMSHALQQLVDDAQARARQALAGLAQARTYEQASVSVSIDKFWRQLA